MAAARAFATVSDLSWDTAAMAKIGQRAENKWVGVKCGIMDQMISAGGKADHALLIDCRSLEAEAVPLPPETLVVILDTATRRGLVDSTYNERREQCEAAALFFNVAALRDVSFEQFESRADGMPEVVRRRARHVITENARTLQAAGAMRQGDAEALGQLMNASHASLRNGFQVSSDELDAMVACARKEEGCLGARMTGSVGVPWPWSAPARPRCLPGTSAPAMRQPQPVIPASISALPPMGLKYIQSHEGIPTRRPHVCANMVGSIVRGLVSYDRVRSTSCRKCA